MPIVPLRPLLEASQAYGFAHGAFNVNTAAQAQAVIEIHSTFRSAAILQGADLANAFMGGRADFKTAPLQTNSSAPPASCRLSAPPQKRLTFQLSCI